MLFNKKHAEKQNNFSFHKLFSHCDRIDIIFISLGTMASMVAGLFIPSISILIGSIV